MRSKILILSFFLFSYLVLFASLSFLPEVSAQSVQREITPKAPGLTSAIYGLLLSQDLFYHRNRTLARYVPYRHTSEELANDESDIILVFAHGYTFEYPKSIYNFTTTESATIKAFLKNLPVVRNNLLVSFLATWNSDGRFPIQTSNWSFVTPSLLPYTFNKTSIEKCNITAVVDSLADDFAWVPTYCRTHFVPSMIQRAFAHPYCLLILAEIAVTIHTNCYGPKADRDWLTIRYCTEGESAVHDTLCPYVKPWLPTGDPNAQPVITIGGDGYPVAGRADQQPEDKGNAGKLNVNLLLLLMMVIVVVISFF